MPLTWRGLVVLLAVLLPVAAFPSLQNAGAEETVALTRHQAAAAPP